MLLDFGKRSFPHFEIDAISTAVQQVSLDVVSLLPHGSDRAYLDKILIGRICGRAQRERLMASIQVLQIT